LRRRLFLGVATVTLLMILVPHISAAEPSIGDGMAPWTPAPPSESLPDCGQEASAPDGSWWGMADWPREKKSLALNLGTVGVVTAIGLAQWDYGSADFHWEDEGWFDSDTRYGGADKLGHAFMAYSFASIYNNIYRSWGYSQEEAIRKGATSSWLLMTLIEVGDGYSDSQGFCWQDEVMNTVGVGMAYLRHRFPAVRERVDFRMEWFPSPALRHGEQHGFFTDYSGQKYLLAFKPDGFLKTGDPLLKALEFQVGYYTRGYSAGDEDFFKRQHRYGYIGIGLNVTYLLDRLAGHRAAGVFDYYQVPYTYLSVREDYN
jgi:Predicted periplasmic lipoprotein (DUF2279)